MKVKVKMLVDAPGSPDGVTVNDYDEGEVYEVTESLATAFLSNDPALAEVVKDAPAPPPAPKPAPAPKGDDAKKGSGPSENKTA